MSIGGEVPLPKGYRRVRAVGKDARRVRWLASEEASNALVSLLELPRDDRSLDSRWRSAELINNELLHHVIPWRPVASGDGRVFAVMPWVEGASLRELLEQEGCFEVSEALWILTQLCGAIAAADAVNLVCDGLDSGRVTIDSSGTPLLSEFGAGHANNDAPTHSDAPLLISRDFLSVATRPEAAQHALGVIVLELLLGKEIAARARGVTSQSAGRSLTSLDAFFSRAGTRFPPSLVGLLTRMLTQGAGEHWPSLEVVVREAEAVEGFDAVAARARLAARVARVRLRRELAEQLASYSASAVPGAPLLAVLPVPSRVHDQSSAGGGETPPPAIDHRRVTLRRIAVPVIVAGSLLTAVLFTWRNLTKRSENSGPPAPLQLDSVNPAVRPQAKDVPAIAQNGSSAPPETLASRPSPTLPMPARSAPSSPSTSRGSTAATLQRPEPTGSVAKPPASLSSTDSALLLAKPVAPDAPKTADKTQTSSDAGGPTSDRIKPPEAGGGAPRVDDYVEQARSAVAELLNGPSSSLPTAIETAPGQAFLAMLKQDKWPRPISVQSLQGSATEFIASYRIHGMFGEMQQWNARFTVTSSSRSGRWLRLMTWQRQ
ncbi:MAG: hypothetical protein IT353_17905 [Gemmatimonadaceae bacterium]|nr:hypothetical protein [Gemmatimonadaceae bacterium]